MAVGTSGTRPNNGLAGLCRKNAPAFTDISVMGFALVPRRITLRHANWGVLEGSGGPLRSSEACRFGALPFYDECGKSPKLRKGARGCSRHVSTRNPGPRNCFGWLPGTVHPGPQKTKIRAVKRPLLRSLVGQQFFTGALQVLAMRALQ